MPSFIKVLLSGRALIPSNIYHFVSRRLSPSLSFAALLLVPHRRRPRLFSS